MRILLIEDNPDHALFTSRVLKKADTNYAVDYAGETKDAFMKIAQGDYDLVICDYRLPESSALEVLKEIRSRGEDAPFIVVTSTGSEKIAVELMREGSYDYLVKDDSYEDVLPMVVKRTMERHNMLKEKEKTEEELRRAYNKLKETQAQLMQSSKMAAIGQLAAGISHELNQPLTGIRGFAQAMLMSSDEKSPIRADIQKIIEQADRIDAIIKNVRLFARQSDFQIKEIDINKPIEDTVMLLSQQFKLRNIKLNIILNPNLPKIKGDISQLQQAMINLISNARDALESVNRAEGKEVTVQSSLSGDRENIELIIRDNGCGISRDDLSNLFNPFFTTKGPDRGIGLGLAIVYRIIENHKGKILVESIEGKGTAFKIVLPIKSQMGQEQIRQCYVSIDK
jgi:two-component system NtrC family sensor kinase